MIELKPGRSLVTQGVTLTDTESTTVLFKTSNYGLDSSYCAILNDAETSVEIAFGGVEDGDPEPVYPEDYFTIHTNGNYEIPPSAFARKIKVWLRGERVVIIY
ncbi:hypothetical protein VPHD481_0011 [Vibrio phage D481]